MPKKPSAPRPGSRRTAAAADIRDAIEWKIQQALLHPLAAEIIRTADVAVKVDVRPARRGYITSITVEVPTSDKSGRKHIADAADPDKFLYDLARAVSVVTIRGDDGPAPSSGSLPN